MKEIIRSKIFVYVLSLSIGIIALSVAYYLVIFLPSKEKYRQEQLKAQQEEEAREKDKSSYYSLCQEEARNKAVESAKRKAKIANNNFINEAVNEGMYLKDDYNDYYQLCLDRYGLK